MRGTKIVVTFGLVTVPCKRGPLTRDARLKAKRVCSEHMLPIKLQNVCTCGEEHVVEDAIPAYEAPDGSYVFVNREACVVDKDGVLDLTAFVDDFDPAFYEKSELLAPDKGGEKPFAILAGALRERGGMAVGTCVINKARRLVGIRWSDALGCLTIHHLAFDSEVRWDDARDSAPGDADAKQVKVAIQLLESLDATADLTDVVDEYDAALRAVVAEASAGHEAEPAREVTVDLVQTLRDSIAGNAAKKRQKEKTA
jgi:DNA end-binding protein Ku